MYSLVVAVDVAELEDSVFSVDGVFDAAKRLSDTKQRRLLHDCFRNGDRQKKGKQGEVVMMG